MRASAPRTVHRPLATHARFLSNVQAAVRSQKRLQLLTPHTARRPGPGATPSSPFCFALNCRQREPRPYLTHRINTAQPIGCVISDTGVVLIERNDLRITVGYLRFQLNNSASAAQKVGNRANECWVYCRHDDAFWVARCCVEQSTGGEW